MAAKTRISNLKEMTLCSVLVAIIFSLSPESLLGVGGRLGTIAAITVVIVWGLKTFGQDQIVIAPEGQTAESHILQNCIALQLFIGVGFLLLSQSWQAAESVPARLAIGVSLSMFGYGLYRYLTDFFRREIFEHSQGNWIEGILLLPCAVVGTGLTYYLSIFLRLGPVLASGIVGVLASLLLHGHYDVLAYTAVFVGMSSSEVLPSVYHVFFASLVVWAVYVTSRRVYQGFGSRLGTMAAGSVLLAQLIVESAKGWL